MCVQPLGMESDVIQDSQISASSYNNNQVLPRCGRLNRNDDTCRGSWVSNGTNAEGEYLQIDLLKPHIITKVATQGRATELKWVKKYYLSYSADGIDWKTYKSHGDARVRKVFFSLKSLAKTDWKKSFTPELLQGWWASKKTWRPLLGF